MKDILDTLVRAAREAGGVLAEASEKGPDWIRKKGRNDYVTAADKAAEAAVLRVLAKAHPDVPLLAEEGSGTATGKEGRFFCVDPLDGTNNFVHGLPVYCVSVGFVEEGRPLLGAVYDPVHDELFAGGEGFPATLNGRAIRVSGRRSLNDAFMATGFPFKEMEGLDEYVSAFKRACLATGGLRRCGAAALDIAWTSCGRFDGFWERGLWPWDVAAASAVLRAAGGVVTDYFGGEDFLFGRTIVAGASEEIAAALRRRIVGVRRG